MMVYAKSCVVTLLLLCGLMPICYADFKVIEINAMLVAHNQVRSGVTPTATNMARLVWDPNLAAVAQNWANQCNFSHNGNRNSGYAALSANPGQVGENIFVTTRPRVDAIAGPNSAVPFWAAELSDYNYSSNTCAAGKVCGHYTQLVWANTLRVGCGISQCPSIAGLSASFNNGQLVVCDYNPAGNFVGQSPYVSGATGSQCPSGLPNVLDELCSPATVAPTAKVVPALSVFALTALGLILAVLGWICSAEGSSDLKKMFLRIKLIFNDLFKTASQF